MEFPAFGSLVRDRLMVPDIAIEHVLVSISFLLSCDLKITTSQSGLRIGLLFSLPGKQLFR